MFYVLIDLLPDVSCSPCPQVRRHCCCIPQVKLNAWHLGDAQSILVRSWEYRNKTVPMPAFEEKGRHILQNFSYRNFQTYK